MAHRPKKYLGRGDLLLPTGILFILLLTILAYRDMLAHMKITRKKGERIINKMRNSEYQNKFYKEKCKVIVLKFHKVHAADVLDKLASVENMQGYITGLIRMDISRDRAKERAKNAEREDT